MLVNQAHGDPDLILPVDASELRLENQARSIFEQLWWYDQVVFGASPASRDAPADHVVNA